MLIRGRSTRVSQPTGPVEIDWANPLSSGLGFNLCNFLRRDTAGDALITRTANLAQDTTTLGQGLSSAANAAFSAALDLSSTTEITVAFILKRNSATGTQVLVEHTINQNNQAGSFLIYTDTTNFLASISNGLGGAANFNVVSCAAPAIGRTTKVVVTLARRGTSARACRIWFDGVEQVTSQPNTGTIGGAFANSTTYFFGRAATSSFANGVIHDTSIWLRSLADAEVAQWSANPWQVFRPIQRRIWVPVAGGGPVTHAATGALVGAGSALAGTASSATTRTASGSLIGPGSTLAGSASRTAGGTTHDATGVLVGAGSTVAGAASRTRVFSSAGVLQGAGALLSGSADRTGAPTVHSASGALLAAGSALSGAAQHKALHTGSGVLAGGGSALAGSASRVGAAVTHTASGVLAGSGSLLDGTGQVGEIVVANGFVFTDTPSALWWKRKPKALSDEVAEQKIKRVVRVIKEIAGKQQPEQTKKQAQREVAQAVAPMLADMPGFDWTPIYRNIVADFERQREEAARIEAVAQIARIRAIEQDDEDILLLMI